MKLFTFLDLKYRNLVLAGQAEFHPFTDGKTKAAFTLIGFMRTIAKWVSMPVILCEYLLVTIHIMQPPTEPVLIKDTPPKQGFAALPKK